jgi:hypothetical protein
LLSGVADQQPVGELDSLRKFLRKLNVPIESKPDFTLYPLTMDLRYQPAFENRVRRVVAMAGMEPFTTWAARPEDVVLGKLMAWAEGRSERQVADIFEMMVFYEL